MVKKSILLLATMLLFTACNFSFDFSFGEDEEVPVDVETEVTEEEVFDDQTGDELVSLNDDWYLYTNYDEGYSLEVPKVTDIYDCEIMDYSLANVTVLKEGNVSFVTPEYDFKVTSDCEKYTVESIPEGGGIPWKIVSMDVANDAELESFVQEMYGDTCSVDNIDVSGGVNINTTDMDGGCFINYITIAKYNEAAGKAYSFDIGQDTNFYLTTATYSEAFDELMADTFMFLE